MRACGTKSLSRLKIKNLQELKARLRPLRAAGKKIVFTNGCFDLLHYGHIKYLEDAKNRGDILVVGINSDTSVKRIKGPRRPIVNQKDRSKIIAALGSVDYVIVFAGDTPLKIIKSIKPDILIKGADWKINNIVGADFINKAGGRVLTIKTAKGRSTTNLIKKIARLAI